MVVSGLSTQAVYRLQSSGRAKDSSERNSRPQSNTLVKGVLTTHYINMPTQFAQEIINQVGEVDGYLLIDPIMIDKPTTFSSGKLALVSKYEPWMHDKTKVLLNLHPVAIWRRLSVTISCMPGVFGRMVTFYGGWAAHDAIPPTTLADMRALHGAVFKTVGGTGDPGLWSNTINLVFDGTVSDVLKTRYNVGVRAVFYYAFTETPLVDKPNSDARFSLEFDGHYDVYGRF